jgi:hypothetical protein
VARLRAFIKAVQNKGGSFDEAIFLLVRISTGYERRGNSAHSSVASLPKCWASSRSATTATEEER